MNRQLVSQLALAVTLLLFLVSPASSQTFRTVDNPLGVKGTYPKGICGNNVVGFYKDSASRAHGYLYDGSSYITIDVPSARETRLLDISDTRLMVGDYVDSSGNTHGFLYDGTNFTTLNHPSVGSPWGTSAMAISGSNIAGYYFDSQGLQHAFVYDGSSYSSYEIIAGQWTGFLGISGDMKVGYYRDSSRYHGFLYDGITHTTFDHPLANGSFGSAVWDISGSTLVGEYYDSRNTVHAFLYNGTNFTSLDHPLGSKGTTVHRLSGAEVVGYYFAADGMAHGFIATVPEPSALVLLFTGLVVATVWSCRRRNG